MKHHDWFLTTFAVLSIVLLSGCAGIAPSGGSAQTERRRLIDGFEDIAGWETGGQREVSFQLSDQHVKEGAHSLQMHVEIDHRQAEKIEKEQYPMGWPSVKKTYDKPIDLSGCDFIEFDVFFESAVAEDPDFALNVTISNREEKVLYRTVLTDLRHGKWAHEKFCIRDIACASEVGAISFWLSESVYKHGAVIDFYIDDLRATSAVDYQAPPVVPVRRPLARSDAAILWLEGPTRKIMRTEEVALAGVAEAAVDLSLARNETEAIQLVLRPQCDGGVGEVSVAVGELNGSNGAKITAENVFWSSVFYVPANEGPAEGLPDGLPGPKPFKADRQWQYPIWLEVTAPAGTPPGNYTAPVTVKTEQGNFEVELRVHVWDFEIPVKQHLRTSTTIYGPWGWRKDISKWYGDLSWDEFIYGWRPGIVELLGKHRLCPSSLAHLPLKWDKEAKKVVLGDTSKFEELAEKYLALGHHFDGMPVPYFFPRDGFLGAKKGSPEYLPRITEAYRVGAEYLDSKGWLDECYVYCVDEVVCKKYAKTWDFDLLNRVFDAIRAAHPKIRLFGAETPSPVLRCLDVWCTNINGFDPDVLAEQHALGNQVWWYNGYKDPRPGMRVAARAVDHRVIPWLNWKLGIDGYLIWTVNRWKNNPWETPNPGKSVAGDHYLLFPNPDGTVSRSIRLAILRDGLEDYEYHWLLDQLAAKLRAAGKKKVARECEDVLRRADAFMLAADNCPHIKPNFIYDSRRRLAKQIEKGSALLAEK